MVLNSSSNSISTPKPTRPQPFTPKRPLSSASTSSADRFAHSTTLSLLSSTHKKIRAAVSTESRTRTFAPNKQRPVLATVPGTPTKKSTPSSDGRPKTPGTPRRGGTDSPMSFNGEMDVSKIDPEEALVDFQTVEPGDVSGEIDEAWLRGANIDHGKEDKVMVSIRIRPTTAATAWANSSPNTVKLLPEYSKSTVNPPPSFTFDAIHTGSANKPVYTTVARSHVHAAMDGYNAVIFAYGQTASGKTFTLSGDVEEPGIIPRAMKDVFAFIRRTPTREYLLRCSYLEIYNESIHDLLAPPSSAASNPVQIQGGSNGDVILTPLREEVVTSLKGVKEVLKRGDGNRRTACTDWNERSSRSHSVFRLVVESRERGDGSGAEQEIPVAVASSGRQTPATGRQTPGNGRQTPGLVPPTPGGPRLQVRGGKSVQTSVLSLIDLAGSEKATSDKERTKEGKYINTSLLTLGSVIGTLAENAAKNKSDHVPYRNSKLTRMLQPSLSGNARISVICTINPDVGAVSESTSTLLFAKRIKNVQLNAQKKEIVDTDALIERYRKEIEDLKNRLAEREADVPVRSRRLSAREQIDESKAMKDLNSRIQQLTKLILTSQTVDETRGDDSRPSSPVKIDFDMSPYQLQQELLAARLQLETQSTQILSLEAALLARPALPPSASESEKDKLIAEQTKTIRELDIVVRGYEDNLGEPLRAVKEDVEREWVDKVEAEVKKREATERWAAELVRQVEKEKQARMKLEEERRALAAFVSKFDALGLSPSKVQPFMPLPGGAAAAFAERRAQTSLLYENGDSSPVRFEMSKLKAQPNLLEQMPEEDWSVVEEASFEMEVEKRGKGRFGFANGKVPKEVLAEKENLPA